MIHERIDESDSARGNGSESHVCKILSDSMHEEAGEDICELRLADSFIFSTVILQADRLRNGTERKPRGPSESLALADLGRALVVLQHLFERKWLEGDAITHEMLAHSLHPVQTQAV